jgi:hypothetical protein
MMMQMTLVTWVLAHVAKAVSVKIMGMTAIKM